MTSRYSRDDVLNALRKVGISRGSAVYVTTSLGTIGLPPEHIQTTEQLCQFYYEAIWSLLGTDGTMIVPAFSYTIGGSLASQPLPFDPLTTDAAIGAFPNFFLKQDGVKRSLDPMLSVAVRGVRGDEFIQNLPAATYVEGSFLARLAKSDVLLLNLGIGPGWLPFVHYIDWLNRAPYRYDKLFRGFIKQQKTLTPTTWVYYAPLLVKNAHVHTEPIGRLAEKAGIWRSSPLGRLQIYSAVCKDYFEFSLKMSRKKPWFLAKGPPVDPLKAELERTGTDDIRCVLGPLNMKTWVTRLARLRRDLISDSMDVAFQSIRQSRFKLKLTKTRTGESCLDWIVPERWLVRKAALKDSRGRTIFNSKKNAARVYGYSLPFKGWVDRERLAGSLTISPQGVPVKSAYRNRDWGFCIQEGEQALLKSNRYFVEIESDHSLGELTYGELSIKGRTPRRVLVCAYLEGPCRANENLSGVVVGLAAYNKLRKSPLSFSVTFLVLPGAVGLAVWCEKNKNHLSDIALAVHLKMLGRDLDFASLEEPDFFNPFPAGGNPLWNRKCPKFRNVTLCRIEKKGNPFYPFAGYGTDKDDVKSIRMETLDRSLEWVMDYLRNQVCQKEAA